MHFARKCSFKRDLQLGVPARDVHHLISDLQQKRRRRIGNHREGGLVREQARLGLGHQLDEHARLYVRAGRLLLPLVLLYVVGVPACHSEPRLTNMEKIQSTTTKVTPTMTMMDLVLDSFLVMRRFGQAANESSKPNDDIPRKTYCLRPEATQPIFRILHLAFRQPNPNSPPSGEGTGSLPLGRSIPLLVVSFEFLESGPDGSPADEIVKIRPVGVACACANRLF